MASRIPTYDTAADHLRRARKCHVCKADGFLADTDIREITVDCSPAYRIDDGEIAMLADLNGDAICDDCFEDREEARKCRVLKH